MSAVPYCKNVGVTSSCSFHMKLRNYYLDLTDFPDEKSHNEIQVYSTHLRTRICHTQNAFKKLMVVRPGIQTITIIPKMPSTKFYNKKMQSVLVSQQVSVSRQFFRKFGENTQYWKTDFHKYSENQFITSNHQNRHRQALLMHAPSSRKQSEGLWCSYLRLRFWLNWKKSWAGFTFTSWTKNIKESSSVYAHPKKRYLNAKNTPCIFYYH